MILFQKLLKPLQEHVTLLFGDAIDELAMLANRVETPPTSDRISTNNRMDGTKVATDVLGCTTRLFVQAEIASLRSFNEVRPAKCASQTFEELLNWRRDAVI